jgi:hypothetical protein
MLALLLAIIATAIATQVFADSVQTALDRIVFAYLPWLRQARADLRAVQCRPAATNLRTLAEALRSPLGLVIVTLETIN